MQPPARGVNIERVPQRHTIENTSIPDLGIMIPLQIPSARSRLVPFLLFRYGMEVDHQEHQGHKGASANADALAKVVVDAGLEVHRALGAGLLESAYERCLLHELGLRGLAVSRQVPLPIECEGLRLDGGYRIDLLVESALIVEVKAVESLSRLHEAQLITYLKLSRLRLGLLLNFNVGLFRDGVRRFVN